MNDLIEILAERLCTMSEEFIVLHTDVDSSDKVNYFDLDDYDKEFYRFQVQCILDYLDMRTNNEFMVAKYKQIIQNLKNAKTIWTVTAHRKYGEHIYLVASFSNEEQAVLCARNHEMYRDGKYYCKITKQELDNYSDYKEIIENSKISVA